MSGSPNDFVQQGPIDEAIEEYERYVENQPDLANAHFNLALLYKKGLRYADALAEYENAVRLGIDRLEEVYSNTGVLYSEMRQADKARAMYERALEIDPEYVPALFNLAALLEEGGDREAAIDLYEKILSIDSRNRDSLARLAHARRIGDPKDRIFGRLRNAITDEPDPLSREGLYFALGKAYDDVGDYDAAFAAYSAANELGKRRNVPYDEVSTEQVFGALIDLIDERWISRAETTCDASPIFICGMYRSGTTLVEQILAAHPQVQAGGEFDLLPWLAAHRLAPYPARLRNVSPAALGRVSDEYAARVQALFPGADHVTDKRPDNFVHLGLVRAMFPTARIVYTRRDRRDNCLSVYFQQLGGNLNYATDLGAISHYYGQHQRLMQHWQALFGEHILTVNYDALVRDPQPVLRRLLDFLGLPWNERCLEFERGTSPVKTASLWQVREPLHTKSSGRWRNYASHIS